MNDDTGFSTGASWVFPEDLGTKPPNASPHGKPQIPGTFAEDEVPKPASSDSASEQASPQADPQSSSQKRRRHWPPRTCRICFETVYPTFSEPSELPNILQPPPNITYTSADPTLGRLLKPCLCKGSSKYVHSGCLQRWRLSDAGSNKRFYECPTCKYRYKLERMAWGNIISSTPTQIALTATIFFIALFLLGFVADPIINFYTEPYAVFYAPRSITEPIEPLLDDEPSWQEHFLKGLASLGLIGFVKAIFTLSPWNWFNIRIGGSSRSGATGRDRMSNISWFVVVIGVCVFLWTVYKGVRAWSRRTLEKVGEKVMDVGGDDDDDEEDGGAEGAETTSS